jgi:hypothetical protein
MNFGAMRLRAWANLITEDAQAPRIGHVYLQRIVAAVF